MKADIKLVIFDLDGTLLNTIDDLAQSVNYVMALNGYPTHSVEVCKYFVGNGVYKLIERATPEEHRTEKHIEELLKKFIEHYAQHGKDNTKPYEGIDSLLESLKNMGIAIAVASNKHHQATVELTNHYFGKDIFTVVYGKRDGVEPKPNPTIVFDIIEQCGVSTNEVLYVGDSSTDMQTATNANVRSVGVTWGFRTRKELEANSATYIIDAPSELIKIIR